MNITDSQMKAVLASAETKGISAEELLQSLINQNFPDESENTEEKICISMITLAELMYGAEKSQAYEKNKAMIDDSRHQQYERI